MIAEAGLIALFHSGTTGIGAGMPGGGGVRLKYSNPMCVDDVAADFPELDIILAHPSFPWQDEALAIAVHKPNVYIDLSGWSPKYFPENLIRYTNTPPRDKMLFGSDFPLITPDRWLSDFEKLADQGRGPTAGAQGERRPAARIVIGASATNVSSASGLASESRLATRSSASPRRIRLTGPSSFFPVSVRGTAGTATIASGRWRGESSERSISLMRARSAASSRAPSRMTTNRISSPGPPPHPPDGR